MICPQCYTDYKAVEQLFRKIQQAFRRGSEYRKQMQAGHADMQTVRDRGKTGRKTHWSQSGSAQSLFEIDRNPFLKAPSKNNPTDYQYIIKKSVDLNSLKHLKSTQEKGNRLII